VRSALALLLVLTLGAAACGDDDDTQAQGVTTTTTTAGETAGGCELTAEPDDAGASTDIVAVLCDGERLELGGQPSALAIGGTVTHADGVRCDGDQLVVLSATSDDGSTYQATAVTYEVDGAELVEVDRTTSTIDASTQAEALDPYYRLDC
jgi:hypothetical protein